MFGKDESDDTIWSAYVLDSVDRDTLEREVAAIRKSLGDPILDFSTIDWTKIRGHVLSLPEDLRRFESGSNVGIDASSISLVESTPNAAIALWRPSTASTSMADYLAASAAIVDAGDDAKVKSAFDKLASYVRNNDERLRAVADYYSAFLPPPSVMQSKPKSVIRRMFEAILNFLRRIVDSASSPVEQVWKVLRDPDAAYLRLRGEIAEFARSSTGGKALDILFLVPDLLRLFVRLIFDSRVSTATKKGVLLALAYLVAPIDLLPEQLLGPIGYLEDAVLLAKQLSVFVDGLSVHPDLLREHWSGSDEQLAWILRLYPMLEESVPYFRSVGDWFGRRRTS